jgi:trans-aconitate 2-methyltransferase
MAWHPATYLAHADLRTRPAHELAARIALDAPALIYDLGCGPGNSTRVLAARWPDARLVGVDGSPEMLAAAREQGPTSARWQLADLADWLPDEPADVVFSNATLQWVAGQEELLPKLFRTLKPGGVLAFQVPANHGEPPHSVIDRVLGELGHADRVAAASLARHVLPQADYYRLLAPLAASLDIWDTSYLQVLSGADPVLGWVKGTALVPVMAALEAGDRQCLIGRLGERLKAQYPPESDGKTLFPFRRRFIVAVRG